MQFSDPSPTSPAPERIVPMINVVFLLLIFFLMTAELAPPDPVEVTAPLAEVALPSTQDGRPVFYLGADGTRVFGQARGEAALTALAAACAQSDCAASAVLLRADAQAPGTALAALLEALAARGITRVDLAVTPG